MMKRPFPKDLSRRRMLAVGAMLALMPRLAGAAAVREITWDDLIPPGLAYPEITGEGDYDEANDTWRPVFDENATKLNTALDGLRIKLPGYIIPMETGAPGVSSFILVPYIGACIHVPPPPPNQLVFVTTQTPWPSDSLWDAIWVTGVMKANMRSTDLADIGYEIAADGIEIYRW